jgi:hypothetical protein
MKESVGGNHHEHAHPHAHQAVIVFASPANNKTLKALDSSKYRLPPTYIGVRLVRKMTAKNCTNNTHDADEEDDDNEGKKNDNDNEAIDISSKRVKGNGNDDNENETKTPPTIPEQPPIKRRFKKDASNPFEGISYIVTDSDGKERRMTKQEKKLHRYNLLQERKKLKKSDKQNKCNQQQQQQTEPNANAPKDNAESGATTAQDKDNDDNNDNNNTKKTKAQEEEDDLARRRNPPAILPSSMAAEALKAMDNESKSSNSNSNMNLNLCLCLHDEALSQEWATAIQSNIHTAAALRAKEDLRPMAYTIVPEVWRRLRPDLDDNKVVDHKNIEIDIDNNINNDNKTEVDGDGNGNGENNDKNNGNGNGVGVLNHHDQQQAHTLAAAMQHARHAIQLLEQTGSPVGGGYGDGGGMISGLPHGTIHTNITTSNNSNKRSRDGALSKSKEVQEDPSSNHNHSTNVNVDHDDTTGTIHDSSLSLSAPESDTTAGGTDTSTNWAYISLRSPTPRMDKDTQLVFEHLFHMHELGVDMGGTTGTASPSTTQSAQTQERKMYASCGAKFGCDWLLYDGPRQSRHAFAGLRILHLNAPQEEKKLTTYTPCTSTSTTSTSTSSPIKFPHLCPYDIAGYVRGLNTAGKLALVATVIHGGNELSSQPPRIAFVDLALEKILSAPTHQRAYKKKTGKRKIVGQNLSKQGGTQGAARPQVPQMQVDASALVDKY